MAGPIQQPQMPEIRAVIGVRYRAPQTYYVRRSPTMKNYPLVWSLLSIQFTPEELPDPFDLVRVQALMEKMSQERLGGIPVKTIGLLSSSTCDQNQINARVTLHMYAIDLLAEPKLNPAYYTDAAWMTPDEYKRAADGTLCGLCLRMWSDYSVRHGLASERFVPPIAVDADTA